MSFVSASDNITDDSNDGTVLSVTDDTVVEENVEEVSVDESSISDVALADDQPNVNKSVKILKKDAEVLGVPNNEPVLGATLPNYVTTVSGVIDWIKSQSDTNIFLGNRTFTDVGEGTWDRFNKNGDNWWDPKTPITNKHIYGGYSIGDGLTSTFNVDGIIFHSDSANLNFNNLIFDGINAKDRLFWFSGTGSSLTNSVINNCECRNQFIWLGGWHKNSLFYVTNCNFTNCRQTYGLNHPDDPQGEYYDGNGQFGAVAGIKMDNCNFINVTSGHHGGALCIADESENGATVDGHGIASEITNTNFINITSRWFAVYMHGNFRTTPQEYYLKDPQIIQNCKFINCSGTYEYSGGLGISHNNVQVKDCEFTNCDGGQGSAIMVGGLDGDHDAFNGRNYQANHVLIENCNFTNNIATTAKKSSHFSGWFELAWGEERNTSRYDYYDTPNGNKDNQYGTWYFKHNASDYYPSGDAGAIYVIGNDTIIRNCIFNENKADDGEGAAIYIYGQRTIVENSKFYNHTCKNGTIFIEGNNATIKDSIFEENYAGNGSAIYILGSRTEIYNSTFKNNNATNGTVYIKGNYTKITSGSDFIENNATYGAGVFIEGANTLISGSNFVKNNATQDGGGMYIKGDKTNITNHSNFTENHAVDGAGIFLGGTDTLISASNFVDNNATHDGAGMYVKGNNTKAISGSNFTGNHAAHDGAGMYIEGMNTLISDSYFERNNATNGAGLYIKGNNTNITEGSDFINNNAVNGAGAYLEGSNTLINGSVFKSNNATYGAGLYIKGNKTNITSRSNFTENNASYGAGIYIEGSNTTISGSKFELNNATHDGGGMYIKGNNTKITSNSNFTENYADNGAGIYIEGSNTSISGSKFELNNATNGAGMYIKGNKTNITSGSDFIKNNATNGAGIYIEGSNTSISGSKFELNNATNDGAGMYVSGSNTEISDSDFELNNATNGAGMYIKGNNTKVISGSDFTENTAVNGGGMYIEGMDTLVSGSTFEKNNATNGAGMYINGNNTNVSKSNFTENLAENGAGIYVDGGNTSISGSNFNENNADYGAGAYIDGSNTTISGSTFKVNEADEGAGAYIDGSNTTISGSTFDDNEADEGAGIYVKGVGTEIKTSTFTNNFAIEGAGGYIDGNDTKIVDSTFKVNDAIDGAGIYVEGVRTEINNSTFTKNDAINGAGGYIDGSDTRIVDSTFEVNEATFGGAGIYVQGSRTKILNTTFYNNTAEYGAGGYINGSNTNISSDSLFKINTAEDGAGIYVEGTSTEILNTTFDENIAKNGGGAYIKGSSTNILNSTFIKNNVTYHGGAVYIDGSESNFKNNNFTYNEAVPDNTGSTLSGLGGAIFVNGNNTYTYANDFEHNKARNGSAIYSSGNNFKLENDLFRENQAWSYLLITEAEPEESLQNTHDVKIEVIHIGGDNMINAIHSNASADQIGLKNVSYVHSSGANLTTNSTRFENPVQGVENSNGGTLLYQDDREYLQNLTIKVVYENDVNNPIYYNDTLLTHYFGDVYVTLPKSTLKAGKYTVTATHPEDWNYKKIANTATFRILPIVDLSVNKTSDKFEYFDDDLAYWNITFYNAANSTNATNIKFDDILPSDFEFINYTVVGARLNNGVWTFDDGPNKGVNVTYDGVHGYGSITSLANGTNITITILSLVESDEENLDHSHNVTSNEGSVRLDCERYTNQTSYKEFEHAVWNFTLSNTGGFTAHNVTLTHLFPIEFEFWNCTNITKGTFDSGPETGRWIIPEIAPGETVKLVLDTIARYDDDDLDNLVNVDYTEKNLNLTLKKTSDKDEYLVDEIANFTITITNNNGCNATNVVLNDVLQPEFEYNGTYTATKGEYNSTTNKWIIPELKEGESATLTIYSHSRIVRGNVTNTVEVSCSEGEWNYANNIAKKTVEVVPLPLPSKSVSNITPDYHGFIEYNLTIYNTGNTTYKKNLTITDTLPVGLDFIEFVGIVGADIINQTNSTGSSVEYILDGRSVKWIITNIENKTSAIITVKLQVNDLGKLITNTSVINSIFNLANDTALVDKLIGLTNNATFMKKLLDLTSNSPFIKSIVNLTNEGATFNKLIQLVNNESYVNAIGRLTNTTFENVLNNLTKSSVGINSTGNLTNNLTVTGPNGTNVTDRCSVYPVPLVDLSVNKTSDKAVYFTDDIVVWTIVVSNAGNGTNATNVVLRDIIPSEFTVINGTTRNGTFNNMSNGVWNIGSLANGTNVTLKVYCLVKDTASVIDRVTNTAKVTSNETDWNKKNNEDDATVKLVPLPEPVKTVNNDTPYYNDVIEFNLTIVNKGGIDYTNVLNVTDALPVGLLFNGTYKVSGADNISFVNGGQRLVWTLTNISKDNATITLWAKVVGLGDKMVNDSAFIGNKGLDTGVVKYVGNLTNMVTVTGPNGTEKSNNKTVYPVPIVDLSVNKTSDKAVYFTDDIVVWTIVVSNAGNGTNATNVILTDLIPAEFTVINGTTRNGTFNNMSNGVWNIGSLANGTNVTLKVYCLVNDVSSVIDRVTNTAKVTSNETDWNKTNNEDDATVKLVPLPEPVKTVNNDTPYYNDVIEFNLTIVNKGGVDYTNVLNVTDALPVGLLFNGTYKVTGADNISFVDNGQRLVWTLTNISKDNATITLWAKVVGLGDKMVNDSAFIGNKGLDTGVVKYVGNLTNMVTVTGPNGTEKSANKTVYPVPIVDLSVNKTSDKAVYFTDDIVVWTIVVSNAGNGTNATNVILTDLIPAEFTVINGTTRNGTFNNMSNGVWNIGSLPNGTNVTLKVYCLVKDTASVIDRVTNTAKVTSNETDWNKTNNEDDATVKLVPLPHPVKTVNNDTQYYNDVIEFNLTIVNEGGVTYTNILNVTDVMPAGLLFNGTYKVSGADNISFVGDNQRLVWTLTNISKDNATITFWAKVVGLGDKMINDTAFIGNKGLDTSVVKYIGNLTNNVTVTGPNGTEKSDNKTVYPVPIVDLSVNKTTDKAVYFADDIVVWTIVVHNAANGTDATNVTLKDVFPVNEFEFISCNSSRGTTYDLTQNVWYIGNLANGTNVTLTVKSRARELGSIVNATNNVTVSSNETDWNLTNNEDNATVKVVPLPHPVKTVNNNTPYYKDIIEFNLTIVNEGNVTYTNILNVTDVLPAGLLFNGTYKVSGADNISFVGNGQRLVWTLTNISKDNATITLWAKVVSIGDNLINDAGFIGNLGLDSSIVKYVGNLTNVVTVTGPNGTEKTDNETVYPVPIVDISVNITSDRDVYFVDDSAIWTIVVSNAGNGTNATNIVLKDIFPSANFEFEMFLDSNGNPHFNIDDLDNWVIHFMENGTNLTFKVYGKAIAPGVNINNTAKVRCDEKEWNYTNNNATKSVNVVVLPYPEKGVNNITPYYNDVIEYNITIVNEGGVNYTSILEVTDSLPDGLIFNGTFKIRNAVLDSFAYSPTKPSWKLTNITKDNATITLWVKVVGLGDLIYNSTFVDNLTKNPAVKYVGNLTNNVTVTGPEGTEKSDNCTVYPVPIVDLSVNKTTDKAVYFADDIVVWTIVVHNAGNGTDATNVTLKDAFPVNEFEFISCNSSRGTTYDLTKNVWYIGNLANGTNVTLTVKSRARELGSIVNATNNVTVSSNETDWNLTNNEDNATVKVVPLPHPVKTVNNDTPYYNGEITYTITVVNEGGIIYTNVLNVTDSLPDGLKFINATVNGANVINQTDSTGKSVEYIVDGQKVKWILTNVSAENATINVNVKVVGLGDEITDMNVIKGIVDSNDKRVINRLGNLTNNVTVTGPNGTEKSDNCTVYPVPIVDVSVNITSDRNEYFIDDIAEWTIVVSNAVNGTNATNVTLNNAFPSDKFDFINCTDSRGHTYTNLADISSVYIGDLANGENVTFTVYCVAKHNGTANYNVSVSCNESEWNLTNNEANKTVKIIDLPHPVKDVNNDTPYYNGEITYTITIVNEGGILYTNVLNVTDSLPDGLKFINATVSGAVVINQTDASGKSVEYIVDGQKIGWILTNVSAENATIKVNVKVVGLGDEITDMNVIKNIVDSNDKRVINRLGNLTNNVTVRGSNGTEKTANKTIYPVPIVDVSVNITSDEDEYFIDDVAVWTIVVSNAVNGTNATNVTLKNFFPKDNFDFINCTDSRGHTYTDLADISSVYIGDLANGENVTFTVYSVAKHNGTADYKVGVSCNESEWNLTNNDANKTVNVVDLPHPEKAVNNNTPYYHGFVEFNLTIVNTGADNYTNVLTVEDTLPDGLQFNGTVRVIGADVVDQPGATHVVVDGRDVYYVVDGQKVIWKITNMTGNSNAVIVIRAKVNALGSEITDKAVIDGIVDANDKRVINRLGNLTNDVIVKGSNGSVGDSANCTVYPVPIVDVSVNITSDKVEYFVDDVAVWTITIHNAANGTNASNIELSELIPEGFDYMYCTVPNGTTFNETSRVWSIPSLANGTNVTLLVHAHAKTPGDNLVNKVNVTCSEQEWNYTNNRDKVAVDIIAFHKPYKEVSNSTPYYHEYVNYTLTVENLGNFNYTSEFDVIDTLPAGLEFIKTLNVTGADVIREVQDGQVVKWALTNISAKSNATIIILVKVNAVGSLTNNLTVIGPRNATNMVNCTINPMTLVDLSVNITSDKVEYFVDDVAVWTITVHNAANGTNASDIELSELVPAGFDYMYCIVPNGTTFNETSRVWSIPSLANGTNITLLVYAHAKVPGDNLTNKVNVSCSDKEWNYTNNRAKVAVDIIAFHKPAKIVSNSTPYYHEYVNYTLTVENLGNFNYTSEFDVIDSLPVGLEFIKTLNITGADVIREVQDGQVVKWTLTNISAKSNATIVILVKVNALGNLTNNLTVIGPRNATDMVNCTINPIPIVDISVNITSDKVEYFVDDVAVWTITVHNAANGTNASNIELSELIPAGFDYMYCIVPNGTTFNETSRVWSIPSLANGTNITLLVHAHAKVPGDNLVNVANATCAEKEWNYTNNKAKVAVDIIAFHKPAKIVSNSTPYYHEYVNYTLTVENLGNFNYTSEFDVIDSLPVGLEFIKTLNITGADVIREVQDGQVVKWALTNISAKSNATIVILVKVNALGNLTNNLTVIGPRGATDMVNCTISPMPIVDLSVNITSDKDEYFVDDVATWTIVVSNAGNGTNATNITLKDLFPSDYFEFVDCVDENGKHYNLTDDWTIPFMGNGTNMTFVVTSVAKVPKVNITNAAEANCTEDEWNYTNNNATKVVSIVPLPNPIKEASNHTPYNRDVIEYNLTVVNTGNNPYRDNLTVIDTLPDGLVFVEVVRVANATVTFFDNVANKTIVWNLTDIPANGKAVITIKVKVLDIGNLTNNLTIVGPRGNGATVNETIYPKPIADLEVTVTNNYVGSEDPCHKGDTIVWTINVTNHGPNTAVNTTLADILPPGCIYVSDDGNGAYDNETGIWSIGDLPVGANVTLKITTIANTTNDTILRNVSVSSDTYDPDLSNNNDSSSVVIPPEADLEAVITNNYDDSEEPCHEGDTVVWTITVINNGPDDAVNTTLKDLLPDGVIYVDDDGNGSYDNETGVWTIGDLPAGENVTLTITTIADTTNDTVYRNVSVSSDTYDPDLSNNEDDSSLVIPPEADLEIIKKVSKDAPHKGDKITWTIIVTNNGPDVAVNTVVTDKLPKGLIYVSDDSLNNYNHKTGEWIVGDIASGESVELNIVTLVDTTNKVITNLADAKSQTHDPNNANNHCNKSTTVPPEADLVITINPDITRVVVGDKVVYTVTVINNGPDTAFNTRATVKLPKELELLGFKPSKGTYDPDTGIWTIGDLAPGEKVTLLLNTKALVTGTIVVKASVISDTYESDLTNNNDSCEVIVDEPPIDGDEHVTQAPQEMHATGNPIVMALLALIAIAGAGIRRKI